MWVEEEGKHVIERLMIQGGFEDGEWTGERGEKGTGDTKVGSGADGQVVEAGKAEDEQKFCGECTIERFKDPLPHQLCIWLHALKYEGEGWGYETAWPDWANEDFQGDKGLT